MSAAFVWPSRVRGVHFTYQALFGISYKDPSVRNPFILWLTGTHCKHKPTAADHHHQAKPGLSQIEHG